MKSFVKEGNDGDDRAALDDDIEQIGLVTLQPVLREQQMSRRRNRDELGDSFNDPENDGNNPIRHPWDKRKIERENKKNGRCET
jgi:hypothetical protein